MSGKYWSELLKSIEPYTPGEQPVDKKYIKLNANENPYPPSPAVIEAIKDTIGSELRLYPDSECRNLRKTIAEYYGLLEENIFVSNGSDELLAFSFIAFFKKDKPLLFPDISYSFYPVYADIFEIDYCEVPLNKGFGINVEGFKVQNGGVIFPNPNAPTGRLLQIDEVESIIKHNKDNVVIVDEAYIDFGGDSAVNLIGTYPNLLVLRTFSKSRSLAGMRIGYAMGDKELISGLSAVKHSFNSYTLNRLSLVAAEAAISDDEYFRETTNKIIKTRERVAGLLSAMGFTVIPSATNFVFISHKLKCASEIHSLLRTKGILVRHFNKAGIVNFLRITIGTDEEMDILLREVEKII